MSNVTLALVYQEALRPTFAWRDAPDARWHTVIPFDLALRPDSASVSDDLVRQGAFRGVCRFLLCEQRSEIVRFNECNFIALTHQRSFFASI